jgi:hypothetical protein
MRKRSVASAAAVALLSCTTAFAASGATTSLALPLADGALDGAIRGALIGAAVGGIVGVIMWAVKKNKGGGDKRP